MVKREIWANTAPTLLALYSLSHCPSAKKCPYSFLFFVFQQYWSNTSLVNVKWHSMQGGNFSTWSIAGKSEAWIYRWDTAAFHNVCVCCFKVQAEGEAKRWLVGFALMVHIKYFFECLLRFRGRTEEFDLFSAASILIKWANIARTSRPLCGNRVVVKNV